MSEKYVSNNLFKVEALYEILIYLMCLKETVKSSRIYCSSSVDATAGDEIIQK